MRSSSADGNAVGKEIGRAIRASRAFVGGVLDDLVVEQRRMFHLLGLPRTRRGSTLQQRMVLLGDHQKRKTMWSSMRECLGILSKIFTGGESKIDEQRCTVLYGLKTFLRRIRRARLTRRIMHLGPGIL